MSWSAPEDWSRWDPERLLVCPYDEVHMIKAKKFQHHLLKCRKNYPDKDFVNCPFNAKHVMLRSEIRHHVSRCPDRSVIEQYNYKGSEKDEDGFYFKGNTSVPSYHKTEELQEPLESWDNVGEGHLQWTEVNNENRPHYNQRLSQSPTAVRDTLSLSPEERERFKQQMRRQAATLRSVNSGTQLPSQTLSTSPGYNWKSDSHERQHSPSTNPSFHHYDEHDSATSSSVQQAQNLAQRNVSSQSFSKPKNPIFEHCIGKMQSGPEQAKTQSFVSSNVQNRMHVDTLRNVAHPCGENENISSQHTTEGSPMSTHSNMELRGGFVENEIARLTLHEARSKPEVAAVSNVCGQPTSPTSTGVKGPQLAGVGRARLLAEARKNNFGGICYSPPKVTGTETPRTTPTVGRGRGMLNYFMQS